MSLLNSANSDRGQGEAIRRTGGESAQKYFFNWNLSSSGHCHVGSFFINKSRKGLSHDVMYTDATRSLLMH